MGGNNINHRRESLLFFPYVSLPQHLRKDLPPRDALHEIFKELQGQGLYVEGRWQYEETFVNKTPEYVVARFFQMIQDSACHWANCDSSSLHTSWSDHSLHLIGNLYKPDVVLVPVGTKSDITFREVLTYCELKESFTGDSQREALKQLTEISGYVSACQLNRRFYIASSLCKRKFTLAAFIRGSIVISEPLDIDLNPIQFLLAVLGLSAASATWCGLDFSMAVGPSNTYKLARPFCKFTKVTLGPVLLHATTDMHGKGTKVPLCEVWERLGAPSKTYPIKMSWMSTVLPGSKGIKLPNDVDIAKLMANRAPRFPALHGLQKHIFGKNDEYRIFSDCLMPPTDTDAPAWDYVKHWPGITIVLHDECDILEAPCPRPDPALWQTGYYPEHYEPPLQRDTTRNILERFNVPVRIDGRKVDNSWKPQDEDAVFTPSPLFGETREHTWVLYRSCGTSIVWFSCRRELLNGLLGAVAGHFNAFMLQILHCDISDPNIMYLVKDASPEAIVPDWPKEQGAYPKRPGMLGDWGYAADLEGRPIVRRITGTFPYMATEFLSQEAKALVHTVRHDLESFFWVLWIVCVNMNGPFYTRRCWQDEKNGSKERLVLSLDSGAATATSSSTFTESSVSGVSSVCYTSTVSDNFTALTNKQDTFREQPWREREERVYTTIRLPLNEEEPEKHAPPIWATPGRHNLSHLDVFRSKRTIPESWFIDCISPYFRRSGSGFLDGLKTLHNYFVKTQEPGRENLNQQSEEITHEKFCEILKNMRDSIPPDMDRTSDGDINDARDRYKQLVAQGGTHGIAISVLDSQQHRLHAKRRVEGQSDGEVPKKRFKATNV